MTSTKKILLSIALIAFLFACSKENQRKSEAPAADVPAATDYSATAPSRIANGLTDGSGSVELSATGGTAPYTYGWANGTYNGVANSASIAVTDANNSEPGKNNTAQVISSSAAVENKSDTVRKFIRTADLKFRVKDVAQATYALEDIAARFEGFVTYTNLFSTIRNRTLIPVSADSSLETIYYVVQNTMTIRVPNVKLDSTLHALAPVIDFLDHRVIHANDVRLQLLENKLRRDRNAKYQQRMEKAVDDKGRRLNETTNAEDKMLAKQEEADNALLENLRLADQIDYSTIQLFIYERETFRRELVPNDKNIKAYGPGFLAELADALRYGWSLLEGILIFLAKSWGVVVFIAALVVAARFAFFRTKRVDE